MSALSIYKQDTFESFRQFRPGVISLQPRRVNSSNYVFTFGEDSEFLSSFSAEINLRVLDISAASRLKRQALKLRRIPFWKMHGLRYPYRSVVKAACQVIDFCSSEILLEGFSMINYGNGTVAMIKRTSQFMYTINIGDKAVSYVKLRIANHEIVDSGVLDISKSAIENLFESL